MSDYKYADCSFCGGEVEEDVVSVVRMRQGKLVMLEGVPAGVCRQCGERYYRGAVVEEMERLMKEPSPSVKREIKVPVLQFAA